MRQLPTQTGSNGNQQTGSSENDQQEICYDKISLLYTDKSKAINRTAAEFISRYGLDGQILHYEYKRNLSWFTDLIPGKWSDFSGWKENLKTLQSDENIKAVREEHGRKPLFGMDLEKKQLFPDVSCYGRLFV